MSMRITRISVTFDISSNYTTYLKSICYYKKKMVYF